MNISFKKIRENIAQIIYVKHFTWKNPKYSLINIIYNIFIISISLTGIIPLIFHLIYPNFNDLNILNGYYISVIIFCFIYIIDFLLRLLTIDIYYETSYLKALRKQIFSYYSNYQFLSSITCLILISIFKKQHNGLIFFGNDSIFTNDVAMIVFAILFLLNFVSIFFRLIIFHRNSENLNILKQILYSKRKSIIITFIIMIAAWLIFSYIVFMVERDSNSNVNNMADAMYFTFISMTTVGLGDITPNTTTGKIFSVIIAIFGASFYAYVGSIFVNIYIEYINKIKQIRYEIKNQRLKENENKKLLSEINDIVLKNLYLSGVIKKNKYNQLMKLHQQAKEKEKIIYSLTDFKFDKKSQKIFLDNHELGLKVHNKEIIKEAYAKNWLILNDNSKTSSVLYKMPAKFIEQIKEGKKMPVIFTSNFINENIEKVFVFNKKTLKACVLELNLCASLTLEKENAWTEFSSFTNMSKNKFDAIFKKSENINVLLVRNFIVYDKAKLLESFGINTNIKINNIYYLK